MQYPPYLTQVTGPSSSQSGSTNTQFDYAGMEDHVKRRDLLPQFQSQRFAALYDGDIAGAVSSSNRIRDLIDAIKNPRQPMVRIASSSTTGDMSGSSGSFSGQHPSLDMPKDGGRASAPIRENPAAPPLKLPKFTFPVQRRKLPAPPVTDVLGEPRNDIAGMA